MTDRIILLKALQRIASLRPAGNIDTAKNTRTLVQQMERVALEAIGHSAESQKGAEEYLRSVLKRIGEMTTIDSDDTIAREYEVALGALADIRGLVNVTLANPLPPFVGAADNQSSPGPRESPRQAIFRDHDCGGCDSGAKPCREGNYNSCSYPRARND